MQSLARFHKNFVQAPRQRSVVASTSMNKMHVNNFECIVVLYRREKKEENDFFLFFFILAGKSD